MTDDAIAIHQQSRRHFADVVGLSRGTNLTLRGLTVLTTCAAIGAGGWAWSEARRSADRVERYVVYLDANSTVVGTVGIGPNWNPVEATYLDFAQRWVINLRRRPTDRETLIYQRGEVIKATDQKLYNQLGPSMEAADDAVGTGGVRVPNATPSLLKIENNSAIVSVRWHEESTKAGAKPADYTATLKIIYVEPKVRREFSRNVLGLYVQEFQVTTES